MTSGRPSAHAVWRFLVFGALGASLAAGSVTALTSQGQPVAPGNLWELVAQPPADIAPRAALTGQRAVVRLNKAAFDALMQQAPRDDGSGSVQAGVVMTLPMPDGTFQRFRVVESSILAPELEAAFPEIKSYRAQGIDDPTATARIGWTQLGFHGQVLSATGTVIIDPYAQGDVDYYVSFRKRDALRPSTGFICLLDSQPMDALPRNVNEFPIAHGTSLRTYRLALAATGEYTVAAGGTKPQALARMTTTMTRVNGIYERELAVRMTLSTGTSADPTALIYTDGATDPYSNNDGLAMLAQNQTNLDAVIQSANYDIGHVFSTGGGGVATLNSPCDAATKARGVTGSSNPVGDPFDVDYVAHEIGHQFGGRHTFNAANAASCSSPGSRSANQAYEVGSGTTIQAYAGICSTQNVQRNSHDYFHVESLNEMTAFITSGTGATCGAASTTGNSVPAIATLTNVTIPARTPFTLTGSATDANGDALTYAWEQYDLGAASTTQAQVAEDDGTRPLFRSYSPSASPSRTFPSLTYILNNANSPPLTYACGSSTCVTGEALPTTGRTMNFQLTVRDNRSNGGAIATRSMSVTVDNMSGPFRVTSPNTAVSYGGGTLQTVTWDVTGTASAPVNAASVRILLSTDGGQTFPTTLLASTPNDGSQAVTLPNTATTQARIKVEAVGHVFFDISDVNFTITAPVSPPDPPTGVSATPGDGQAAVSFTAPVNTGGSAISGYTVTSSPGGVVATGAASPIAVTGLTNGTAYTFTVRASNATGTSNPSTASSAVTPRGVPGVPTSVSAVAGNAQAIVSFAAPASNGAAITSYTVTSSPGGVTATGAASPIAVPGLTNGTAYTFTVTATNAAGTGAASAPSPAVTPATVPGAAAGVTGTPGNAQVTVSFTAPVNTGGSAISGYTVTSSPGGVVASGAASPITVTGLTNGTAYTFTVTATNAAGTGAASAPSPAVTPATVPGAPTGVSGTPGNGQVSVSFTPPASNGGLAITGYTVTASPGNLTATGPASPITVTGLTNGTAYTFTVRAFNAPGAGAGSSPSAAVTPLPPLGTPTNFAVTSIVGNTVMLSWNPAAGLLPTTAYLLSGGVAPGETLGSLPIPASGNSATVTLPTGAFYLRLFAMSGETQGPASNEIRVFVNVLAPPSAPINLLGAVTGSGLALSWINTAAGGAPTGVLLEVTGSLSLTMPIPLTDVFAAPVVPPGTYTIQVRTINDTGRSASASNAVTLTIPGACSGAPLPPTQFTASRSGNTISVSWQLPASGAAATSYLLNVSGGFNGSIPTTARSMAGTVGAGSYTLSVVARNACGDSAATAPQTVVVP